MRWRRFPLPWGRRKSLSFGIKPPDSNPLPPTLAKPVPDAFKFRWDVLLFLVFFLTTVPNATGVPLHEWTGLAIIPVLLVHLLLNWTWIIRFSRQFFGRLPGEIRFNHLLDTLLFVGIALVMFSGLLASQSALRTLGIPLVPDPFWRHLHEIWSNVLIVMIGVHVAMHARWIIARLRRLPASNSSGKEPS